MPTLLQVDFPFTGPFGDEMAAALSDLALAISEEPGFIWKIWTENETEKIAGGTYLFANEAYARAYLEMHIERLKGFGITGVSGKVFDVNEALSETTRGPIT